MANQVGGEALVVVCHSLPLQGLLHLSQLHLALGQILGKPGRDNLGL
jgi:hypothetical protein